MVVLHQNSVFGFVVAILLNFVHGDCGTTLYDSCPKVITVDWMSIPPYIYQVPGKGTNGTIITNGTLKIIVERIIQDCCCHNTTFRYLKPANESTELNSRVGNGSAISMPIYGLSTTTRRKIYPYFPVINSPGIIYLQKLTKTENVLVKSLGKSWPIMVLIFIFATLSGFVIWTLDSYANPVDFPRTVVPGIWDGFWWAFVSMTTVGYGDKAPSSFQARVFAFFWCILGMVIIGIFTSTLSTDMTTAQIKKVTSLYGLSVITLNNSKEHQYGTTQNAVMKPVNSIDKFLAKMKEDDSNKTAKISGGLIDAFVAGHEAKLFTNSANMRFSHVEEHDYTYGFTIANELSNGSTMTKCIRRKLSAEDEKIFEYIQQHMVALPKPKENQTAERVIDGDAEEFKLTVYSCLGAMAFLYLLCLLWHCFYYKPKQAALPPAYKDIARTLQDGTLYGDVVIAQFFDIENLMVKEVMEFYHNFKLKIEHMRRSYAEDYTEPQKQLPKETPLGVMWSFRDVFQADDERKCIDNFRDDFRKKPVIMNDEMFIEKPVMEKKNIAEKVEIMNMEEFSDEDEDLKKKGADLQVDLTIESEQDGMVNNGYADIEDVYQTGIMEKIFPESPVEGTSKSPQSPQSSSSNDQKGRERRESKGSKGSNKSKHSFDHTKLKGWR